jgi:hypothetical protein
LQAEAKPVRGNAASTFRRKVFPFAEEAKTTPWVAGGKVSRRCDSQRVSADVDALGMWGGVESRQRHYAKLAMPDGEWMGNEVQAAAARE